MGIGDWGLGIGDWGLGPIPNPPSPNPQSPIPQRKINNINFISLIKILNKNEINKLIYPYLIKNYFNNIFFYFHFF